MEDSHITIHDKLNSMIGPGTRFKGEFELDGFLRIDGDFIGEIRTTGKVLIGRNGRVECKMYAANVIIGGIVRGDIVSTEKVTILSTAMVIGNITTPRLIIEEGVIFNGNCRITNVNCIEFNRNFLEKNKENGNTGDHTKNILINQNNNGYKPAVQSQNPVPVLISK